MIFALMEKESDEMAFGADLYRQLPPARFSGLKYHTLTNQASEKKEFPPKAKENHTH